MSAGVLPLSASRQPAGWERFGVAIVTLLGLLSLAVALHIDGLDRASSAAPVATAR